MICQPQSHNRRLLSIPTPALLTREPESLMSPMEVMIEELQADQRIPRGISFRKGMRFASEGTQPITEGAVDSLDVNSTGFGNNFA